ncbi:polar amino acid ABC transporter, inner membrane subunit [Leptothrix cholodnii SP-6]|uniref:Polar amino acid ABC transporter, inner membrane subunit n=1 Tax=Leptothrix cholodnii (strain ATCC 51168 / LMG 8142 / SP-6) TaxID=395495 RepID=B1Y2R2_LEPCP|nr:ABC transporter permease subunit [Leptothrix cholodnii]ACB34404.1 polar amino acid ABC transporter, inner membrane subunit [Leptothrix cholodnii SP-6]
MSDETAAPRRPPARRRSWAWSNPATRGLVYQLLMLALVAVVVGWLVHNTLANMALRGIRSGWDFLTQTAGFDIGESLIAFESIDPYWRAFLVGLLNTLRVALIGIVLITLLGTALGVGRYSRNALVRGLCYGYVELFRNVPILVQLLIWYLLMVEFLPEAMAPLDWGGRVFLSKSGLSLPWLAHSAEAGWSWSIPEPGAFVLEGGVTLSPEFLSVLLGLTFYTSSFVAEVVRAGIASVPRGQTEAAHSIGLSRAKTLRLVVLPQALRVIIPPLTNQYLNLTKNSSLAVVIGYPDVVSIANTALNQTGRAVECIAIIMAVYLSTSLGTAALMNAYNRRVAIRER